jgi:hypothetical protein
MCNDPTDIMSVALLHSLHLWAEFRFDGVNLSKQCACGVIKQAANDSGAFYEPCSEVNMKDAGEEGTRHSTHQISGNEDFE